MLSPDIQKTLQRALQTAAERRHEYATLEHLLLALIEDIDAVAVFRASGVDLDMLTHDVTRFLDNDLAGLATDRPGDPKPTAGFQRVVQRATTHVQSSGGDIVTGANLLVALFSERESHAVYFLSTQDMTRLDAVNFITHGIAKGARPSTKPAEDVQDAVLAETPASVDRDAMAAGLDALRTALALIRDIESTTPAGDRRDAVATSLAQADKQFRIAEAHIAYGFGYPLCQCAFPPTPMLHIGEFRGVTGERVPVHECPRCKRRDAP